MNRLLCVAAVITNLQCASANPQKYPRGIYWSHGIEWRAVNKVSFRFAELCMVEYMYSEQIYDTFTRRHAFQLAPITHFVLRFLLLPPFSSPWYSVVILHWRLHGSLIPCNLKA